MISKNWWEIKPSCVLVFLMVIGLHPNVSSMDSHINSGTYCSQPNLPFGSDFKIGLKESEGTDKNSHSKIPTEINYNPLRCPGLNEDRQELGSEEYHSGTINMKQDLDTRLPRRKKMCYQNPVDVAKKHVLTEEERKKILEVSANQSKIKKQIDKFQRESLYPSSRIPRISQIHIPNLKEITNQLYDRKKIEILAGQRALLRAENVVLNSNAVDVIFLKVTEDLFAGFRKAVDGMRGNDIGRLYYQESRWNISLLSDIIIGFFLDLKKLQLVTPETLSQFQENDQGKFFSSLIMAKYPQDYFFSAYLNFDIRLSIAEDPNLKGNFREAFQALDGTTLNHVELQIIKYQLECNDSNNVPLKFHELLKGSLTKASPGTSQSVFEMRNLLENILAYVSIPTVQIGTSQQTGMLLSFKALHGMTRMIDRNFPEVISNEFKQSLTFQQLQLFREAIGLISSANHHAYITTRSFTRENYEKLKHIEMNRWDPGSRLHGYSLKELDSPIQTLKVSTYLTDSNKNRRVLNFDLNTKDEDVSQDRETLRNLIGSQEWPDFKLYSYKHLDSNYNMLDAKERFVDQYKQYFLQINKLQEKEDGKDSNFSNSMGKLVSLGLNNFQSLQKTIVDDLVKLDCFVREFYEPKS